MTEVDRAAQVDSFGRQWLTEVAALRREAADQVPASDATPGQVYQALLDVRGRLDRVEEILTLAMMLRSSAEISAREKADRAADELDSAIRTRAGRAKDFEGTRERVAAASIDALAYTQQARAARKLADQAASIEARIRLAYRGLEATRADLHDSLRHVSWEANNDR